MGERQLPSPYKEWAVIAQAAGWTIEQGRRHIKWFDKKGQLVSIVPNNRKLGDADPRRAKNFRANLRRAGLPV